jgi:hypothetical protein
MSTGWKFSLFLFLFLFLFFPFVSSLSLSPSLSTPLTSRQSSPPPPPPFGHFDLALYKTYNHVVLLDVPFGIWITFSCYYSYDNTTNTFTNWPPVITTSIDLGVNPVSRILENVVPNKPYYITNLSITSTEITRVYVTVNLKGVSKESLKVNVISGWLSIIPPIFTIATVVVSRQVCVVFLSSFCYFLLSSHLIFSHSLSFSSHSLSFSLILFSFSLILFSFSLILSHSLSFSLILSHSLSFSLILSHSLSFSLILSLILSPIHLTSTQTGTLISLSGYLFGCIFLIRL